MRKPQDDKRYHLDTGVLHEGFRSDPATTAVAVPIYQTTAFEQGDLDHTADVYNLRADGYTYTRIINPTNEVLEKRLAFIERGVAALVTASGQSANALTFLNLCTAGDNIVASPYLYGNTWNLLKNSLRKIGIEARFVDSNDPDGFLRATDNNTRCYFGETLANPKLAPFPVRELSTAGNELGIPVVVDNTLCSTICSPIELGATIVTLSTTKYIGGHGTSMGGAIVDSGSFPWATFPNRHPGMTSPDPCHGNSIWTAAVKQLGYLGASSFLLKARMTVMRDLGACASPFNSFLLLQGLETLPLRMKKHCENARHVATWLHDHPLVERVVYPLFFSGRDGRLVKEMFDGYYGPMVLFEVKGGEKAGRRFMQSLQLFYHVSNVGDSRSLATHPVSTTHTTVPPTEREKSGIRDGSVRLCVGIEHIDDIIRDLERAIEHASHD
jgi:O-acetylhomoserine (thiol)-lyase